MATIRYINRGPLGRQVFSFLSVDGALVDGGSCISLPNFVSAWKCKIIYISLNCARLCFQILEFLALNSFLYTSLPFPFFILFCRPLLSISNVAWNLLSALSVLLKTWKRRYFSNRHRTKHNQKHLRQRKTTTRRSPSPQYMKTHVDKGLSVKAPVWCWYKAPLTSLFSHDCLTLVSWHVTWFVIYFVCNVTIFVALLVLESNKFESKYTDHLECKICLKLHTDLQFASLSKQYSWIVNTCKKNEARLYV